MRGSTQILLVVAVGLMGCAQSRTALCSADELQLELDGANVGDVIRIGPCRVEGSVNVPAGVSLQGSGIDRSTLWATEGEFGVQLRGDGTKLSHLTVESTADIAIQVEGTGAVAIERVNLNVRTGHGLAIFDVDEVRLERVRVRGAVLPEDAEDPAMLRTTHSGRAEASDCRTVGGPRECADGDRRSLAGPSATRDQACRCGRWATVTSVAGIVMRSVDDIRMRDVEVEGFAELGVGIGDEGLWRSQLSWEAGAVTGNLTAGLLIDGAVDAELRDVAITETIARGGILPSAALVTMGDVGVHTTGLRVEDNDGQGVIHAGGAASHDGFVGARNGDAAIWSAEMRSFTLTRSAVEDNRFAGVVTADVGAVTISDSAIARSALGPRSIGSSRLERFGDGVHVVGARSLTLRRVDLNGHDRVGLVIDTADGPALTIEDVAVRGAELGAVAGPVDGGTLHVLTPRSWDDSGIRRLGATATNDDDAAGADLAVFASR